MTLLQYIPCAAIINSPSYLDLGGALAAFGLIFAVYQLRNPKLDTVLRIRSAWQRNLFWIFGIIGLLLILIRVLITEALPIHCLIYPFNNPVWYEIAAYIFFALSPLCLIYLARPTRHLFNKKTARKFYEIMVSDVSRSDEKWTDAALEVLMVNFDAICKSIAKDDPKSEMNKLARSIIDVILSEESIVKALTTRRLDALQYIFFVIEKYDIKRTQCDIGIPAIVRNLFLDEGSFFYKHKSRDGLALSSNIYETIFESSKILTNFNLFGYPTLGFSTRTSSLIGTTVFIEALSKAIATYLKTGKASVRYINDGFEYLSNVFGDICSKISGEERRGVDTKYMMKDEWWTLHTIAYFLGHDYPFLVYEDPLNQEVIEIEKTASEASFFSSSTINAGVAAILYKAFEQLSYIKKSNDIYHTIHELLQGMTCEENYKEGYRNPFEKRVWRS